jgi:hypothetical protein
LTSLVEENDPNQDSSEEEESGLASDEEIEDDSDEDSSSEGLSSSEDEDEDKDEDFSELGLGARPLHARPLKNDEPSESGMEAQDQLTDPSAMRDRLQTFLARMENENAKLEEERAAGTLGQREIGIVDADDEKDVIIKEDGKSQNGPYVEMVSWFPTGG